MRTIRHILRVFNFLWGLVRILLLRKKLAPPFVNDLRLRVPFVVFMYSATWLSKYFHGPASGEAVMDATRTIFGIRRGDK